MALARVGGLLVARRRVTRRVAVRVTLGIVWLASASCGGSSRREAPLGVTLGSGGTNARGGASSGGLGGSQDGARSGTGGNATNTSGLGGMPAAAGASAAGHPAAGGLSSGTAGAGGAGGMSGTGMSSAGANSSAGAGTSAGRSSGGASAGSSGASARGGMTATGEGGAATGGTGSSVGGAGPKPGFGCYGTATCGAGQRCVDCDTGALTVGRCTPDPNRDPAGYQAAVADCLRTPSYSDCDGPEDCVAGEYCVIANNRVNGQCQTDPAPNPATCCFSCDATPVCTLCWIDNDCPMGFLCAPTTGGAPNDVGGCQPAL